MSRLRKLARILGVPEYRTALLRHALPAGLQHESVLRLKSYRTVIDIGSNRGQFALVAKRCCPRARIIAFEPLGGPARKFRTVFKNDSNVVLHQLAIGPVSQVTQMYVSARDHSSSLLPIGRLQSSVFPGTELASTETVRVERLDAIVRGDEIESPAMLKLDVQGYELEALKGCDRLLSLFDCVYAECSFLEFYEKQASTHDVIEFLMKREFRLQSIHNIYTVGGAAVQGDFLFMRTATLQGSK